MRRGTCTLRILNGLLVAAPLETLSDAASSSFVKSLVQLATSESPPPIPTGAPALLGEGDRERNSDDWSAKDCCVRGLEPRVPGRSEASRRRGLEREEKVVGDDGVCWRHCDCCVEAWAWRSLKRSSSSL